jgi:hypothetical protein
MFFMKARMDNGKGREVAGGKMENIKLSGVKSSSDTISCVAKPEGNSVKGNFIAGIDIGRKLLKKMAESDRIKRLMIFNKEAVKKKVIREKGRKTSLKGLFSTNKKLVMYYKGNEYKAQLLKSGILKMGRKHFTSLSGAAVDIAGHARDGWTNWMFRDIDGKLKYMDELR